MQRYPGYHNMTLPITLYDPTNIIKSMVQVATFKGRRLSSPEAVRSALARGEEMALLDVRPEVAHASGHPLFAASLPLERLELEVLDRVPNQDTRVVLCDDDGTRVGRGLARIALLQLEALGYRHTAVLDGGVDAWAAAGFVLFKDVNVPSKAFAELVAHQRSVPFISPEQLHSLLRSEANVAVADVRRLEEHATMSIPTGRSAPGVELVLRARDVAPDPATLLVVNCAGRTRSIIGTESLRQLGVPNQVAALENGTIGWELAGFKLRTGSTDRVPRPAVRSPEVVEAAARLADRAGVRRSTFEAVEASLTGQRCVYRFDVRQEDEYVSGHPRGYRWAAGGQLLQETDYYAPVRGASIALADDDGVRANMTASWLAQMGWDVAVVDGALAEAPLERGPWHAQRPAAPSVPTLAARDCHQLVDDPGARLIEVGPLPAYQAGHLRGSAWARRSDLAVRADELLGPVSTRSGAEIPRISRLVLMSEDEAVAAFALATLPPPWAANAAVLRGGKASWRQAGLPLEKGAGRMLSADDAYHRPYEGAGVDPVKTRAYIDWELGLVAQLGQDGTHHFRLV